ncbi:hypothetical protein RFI_23162 [Reticulomyxa filosa]|uniref:Cyclic nucleotide-binding domain-containing protein n=1 Tax=Reticulomyxa filosa TaxID=46433 RepID=X6MM92_RETFI|nr:hypothetical protein RFI_23162 [Reticulomyxa filosa]|eukprot:ETO14205.1 hypothetical protein RFI_23162 [Reticulomyxa filosa]
MAAIDFDFDFAFVCLLLDCFLVVALSFFCFVFPSYYLFQQTIEENLRRDIILYTFILKIQKKIIRKGTHQVSLSICLGKIVEQITLWMFFLLFELRAATNFKKTYCAYWRNNTLPKKMIMEDSDVIIDLDNPNYKVAPLQVKDSMKEEKKNDELATKRPRRFSVSAEESNEHSQRIKDVVRKIYTKKPEAVERIRNSVSELFIWKGLKKKIIHAYTIKIVFFFSLPKVQKKTPLFFMYTPFFFFFYYEQQSALIDAMFEKKVSKGEEVIKQGDNGDYFYVIESGTFEVWKSSDVKRDTSAKKVFSYDGKGSFGELALLYNAPRAATVRAATDGLLWVVDGETFRYIMISSRAKKRTRFDDQIADILEVFQFEKGDYVITQGDENAEQFFIIQNGSVEVTLNIPNWNELEDANAQGSDHKHLSHGDTHTAQNRGRENGNISKKEREKYVKTLREGCYFGERALLLNCPRSANVVVSSQVLRCAAMDKASFLRFVEKSSVYDKIRRSLAQYSFSEKLHSGFGHDPTAPGDDSEDEMK